ncbi:MAG TPA: alcohol dehydrogenase catalytic domain-containing protein [bacterium]|nr:MAG: putative zinc-type alcohol dehydrogenase-like protein YjmD [bacterium ADurb.Bin236]HOY61587.1 alcohol dehydrogenase catalytic domain-containing protein [bacterium]HPI77799.1 alcohol dehydrogenase catalytic domain-containing protein [bacterium]HPN93965.1 alcohol dehydrogenase catalytic domain-containing protein [bacterium]
MSDTMKAAIFEGEGKIVLKQVPVPKIKDDFDVLLKVEAASICGTDCQILKTPPGHPATPGAILGHEYVGQVLETGKAVSHLKPGDRVAVDPNLTCGLCPYCRMAMPNMCENMTTLGIYIDGGFAEYNLAPAKALHKIPEDLSTDLAIFAEPLSCVVNGATKAKLMAGESVVVLGAGPIGLYYTALMKAGGAGKVIVSEVNAQRADMARKMGADIIVNTDKDSLKDVVMAETGIGADLVIDAVGCLMTEATSICRRGARVLLFGMNSSACCECVQYEITRYELSIIGTFISNHSFPAVIRLLKGGKLPLEKLITHRLKLDDILDGIEIMKRGEGIEIIVAP